MIVNYKSLIINYVTDREDYRRHTATVNVPANVTSASFTINIINDDVSECNESFKLMLSVPSSTCGIIIGGNDTSEVMIRDDDGRRSVSDHVVLFTY